ncbi:MAG: family 20 glycosylhydrolase [Bacteroidota bacterium]
MKYLPLLLLLLCACTKKESIPPTDLSQAALVPIPAEMIPDSGALMINQVFRLEYQPGIIDSQVIDLISQWLTDAGLQISSEGEARLSLEQGKIDVGVDINGLEISENEITLSAGDVSGLIHAAQTLRQLLLTKPDSVRYLPTGKISDSPRFAYRGFMLDVSRHFFPPETVMQIIDYLSLYKFNYLHLHLSDDQGWRLEIKAYPRLTEIGGSTEVGGGPGGFYTQEDYLALQEYALLRGITIVPEFDLPGHTNAALASYAELNCDGKARELYTGTDVGFSSLCVGKEYVYEFLDTMLAEVAQITKGPYIHIGGDEVHTLSQSEYNGFIEQVASLVSKHDKKIIGWDEIAQAELPDGAVAQYWNFAENAKAAVAQGNQLIFSPATHAYLDMKYDSTTELGLSWAGYTDLADAYNWDPLGMVEGVEADDILGIEAPLWSETIEDLDDIEYMLFPRIAAISEVAWSSRDFEAKTYAGGNLFTDFERRLLLHQKYWDEIELNYHKWK